MYKIILAVALISIIPLEASVADSSLGFKRLRGSEIVLSNCPLAPGLSKFSVASDGRTITPISKKYRLSYKLPKAFQFFSCNSSESGSSLLVKVKSAGPIREFSFSAKSFPLDKSGGIASACGGGIQRPSTGVLWKPAADAGDARLGKPVVLLQGGNKTRSSSIRILAKNGKEVCHFSYKAPDTAGINGNADHYYSGWKSGCAKTASQISAAAKSTAGSADVYIEGPSRRCFGPIIAGSRAGGISG